MYLVSVQKKLSTQVADVEMSLCMSMSEKSLSQCRGIGLN